MSYLFYAEAIYYETIRDCYEAVVITSFFYLLLQYVGDTRAEQHEVFRAIKFKKWFWPLGFWKYRPEGLHFLWLMKVCILQYAIIRPACTIAAVVLEYYGLYCLDSWLPNFGHVWIAVAISLSVTVAMYCIIQFYLPIETELKPYSPVLKFLAVKTVVFLTFWQSSFLSVLAYFKVIHDTEYMTSDEVQAGINALLETFEMMIFAFVHIKAFTYLIYRPANHKKTTSKWRAMIDVMDYRDWFREMRESNRYIYARSRGRFYSLVEDIRAEKHRHLAAALGTDRAEALRLEMCREKDAASNEVPWREKDHEIDAVNADDAHLDRLENDLPRDIQETSSLLRQEGSHPVVQTDLHEHPLQLSRDQMEQCEDDGNDDQTQNERRRDHTNDQLQSQNQTNTSHLHPRLLPTWVKHWRLRANSSTIESTGQCRDVGYAEGGEQEGLLNSDGGGNAYTAAAPHKAEKSINMLHAESPLSKIVSSHSSLAKEASILSTSLEKDDHRVKSGALSHIHMLDNRPQETHGKVMSGHEAWRLAHHLRTLQGKPTQIVRNQTALPSEQTKFGGHSALFSDVSSQLPKHEATSTNVAPQVTPDDSIPRTPLSSQQGSRSDARAMETEMCTSLRSIASPVLTSNQVDSHSLALGKDLDSPNRREIANLSDGLAGNVYTRTCISGPPVSFEPSRHGSEKAAAGRSHDMKVSAPCVQVQPSSLHKIARAGPKGKPIVLHLPSPLSPARFHAIPEAGLDDQGSRLNAQLFHSSSPTSPISLEKGTKSSRPSAQGNCNRSSGYRWLTTMTPIVADRDTMRQAQIQSLNQTRHAAEPVRSLPTAKIEQLKQSRRLELTRPGIRSVHASTRSMSERPCHLYEERSFSQPSHQTTLPARHTGRPSRAAEDQKDEYVSVPTKGPRSFAIGEVVTPAMRLDASYAALIPDRQRPAGALSPQRSSQRIPTGAHANQDERKVSAFHPDHHLRGNTRYNRWTGEPDTRRDQRGAASQDPLRASPHSETRYHIEYID